MALLCLFYVWWACSLQQRHGGNALPAWCSFGIYLSLYEVKIPQTCKWSCYVYFMSDEHATSNNCMVAMLSQHGARLVYTCLCTKQKYLGHVNGTAMSILCLMSTPLPTMAWCQPCSLMPLAECLLVWHEIGPIMSIFHQDETQAPCLINKSRRAFQHIWLRHGMRVFMSKLCLCKKHRALHPCQILLDIC